MLAETVWARSIERLFMGASSSSGGIYPPGKLELHFVEFLRNFTADWWVCRWMQGGGGLLCLYK